VCSVVLYNALNVVIFVNLQLDAGQKKSVTDLCSISSNYYYSCDNYVHLLQIQISFGCLPSSCCAAFVW
jgi:hypothetical protein